MNLLEPDLLAELYIAVDHKMHGHLSVTKLGKAPELSLEDTVGQIIQLGIRNLTDWGHAGYGVRFSGWIGSAQPIRPELRALIDATAKLAQGHPSPAKIKAVRAAYAAYDAVRGVALVAAANPPTP